VGANTLTASAGGKSVTFTATGVASGNVTLGFDRIATGLSAPLFLGAPPGDARLFVVEQAGRVRVIENGQLLATPFLDLTSKVWYDGGERGLLSMAFHPQFASNGYLYVCYTDIRDGSVVVERYTVTADRRSVDLATAKRIIAVPHPAYYGNHNGGLVAFGPDGKLYLGVGDGGGGGDPLGSGQSLTTLLGKLVRIDVDAGDPYAVPPDNPFAGRADARPEIWAYGLRNPWRWTFDAPSRSLYIADVGQNLYEEVDVVPATAGGLNFGWNVMEASSCYNSTTCSTAGLTLPAFEYGHAGACSITGGYVYRGAAIPELVGQYFYSDYCAGWIRSFRWDGAAVRDTHEWSPSGALGNITSFGLDAAGEMYVVAQGGTVYKIVRR
jgi:glucose/arabinose dehydrogenase